MSQFKKALLGTTLLFLLPLFIRPAAAQEGPSASQPNRSYELSLQVLIGTNEEAAGTAVPQGLSAIIRDIKPRFSFQNYRLANTYFGRIGTAGTLEYKSLASITGQDSGSDTPSFLEWSMGRVFESPDGTKTSIQVQPFRFGARVPVRTAASTITYESIGFNANRLNLRENVPTLVGTLDLPKTSGTLFLVLTARPVEE